MKKPPSRRFLGLMALVFLSTVGRAQSATTSTDAPDDQDVIVVTAKREAEIRGEIKVMTQSIARRPRIDKPIARQYGEICIGVLGLAPDHASVLIRRMQDNARRLDIAVGEEGCRVNTLIAFVRDSRAEVVKLRKELPWLFGTLLGYEYDRILKGNGAVQAWHATQEREVDGKEFSTLQRSPGRSIQQADPFTASRFGQQLRTDMLGSIILIDNAAAPGKTLQQLADYASMRSYAAVDDFSSGQKGSIPSILSLFAENESAPAAMSDFDWAYLEALYRLQRNAHGAALHDAAWTLYRRRLALVPE